jgi:hypothetical protein
VFGRVPDFFDTLPKQKESMRELVVDNNGCIKTTKEVKAGTELVF